MAWTKWTRWTVGLALAAAACGGDDDNGGTTAPPQTIGVTLAAPTLSVTAGQSGTVAATVARGGGYTGAVNLTVEGAPSTVTATANPASLAGGVTASTISVATTSATPAGTYNLTVRAAGTAAVAAVTAPLTLTVTAPAPAGGFTVALAAPTLTVTQGAAATNATLAITRTGGFAGAVTVTATGAPAGLTVTPAAATTGNSVDISVQAAPSVAPGTYAIALSAAGAGIAAPQTATLNVTVQAAVAPDFTIGNATVTVQQGAAAQTANVAVTRTGGFAGAVTLTTTGTVPAGLTVTPAAASTGNTVGVTVQAAPSVAPGTYTINLAATGAGVAGTKAATLTVTVTGAVQVGDFAIAVTPTTVSLQQGQTATATVNITRTGGFAGVVDVTVGGLPAGVTAQIVASVVARRSPAASADPVAGSTATIRFTAAPNATPGNFTFTVSATAAGIAGTKTATGTGTVTAASTGGGNVGLNFCAAEAPIWVGFQSENGAWQRATIGANNQASVNITGARGAVAYVTSLGTGEFQTSVFYGTPAELTNFGANLCGTVTGGKTYTGTVAGLGANDQGTVTIGGATASLTGGATSFTINDVPPGPRDLLAVRSAFQIGGAGFSITPNRIVLRRDVNLANGASLGAVDFNGPDSFAPATAQVTVSGAGSGEAIIPFVSLQTASGTGAAFFTGFGGLTGGGTGPQTYYGLPTSQLRSTDYHLLAAIAFPFNGQTPDQSQGRVAAQFFREVTARTLTLGASLATPAVTIASSSPYPRPRVVLTRQTEYGDAMTATFSQSAASGTTRAASITALASYLQGAGSWDLTFPDLSAAPGFDANWMLRPGQQTNWSVQAASGSGITLIGQTPTEGSSFRAAFRAGTVATLRALRR